MTAFGKFENIEVGDSESIVKKITEDDVRKFVEMTGDNNPLHVDRDYAETTSFKDIVVHGMLGASFISTVIGTRLPGTGALWTSQSMDFILPVRLGDELTITCTVEKKHESQRLLELRTEITNQNEQLILKGKGIVKVLTSKQPAEINDKKEITKTAVVTGGAGGIGKAICLKLAADGYNIVLNFNSNHAKANDIVAEINKGETSAIAVQADISTEDGVLQLYQHAINKFRQIDILVNNASPRINPKSFKDMNWDDIQKQLDVQLKGAFMLSQTCLPSMIESGFGRIINISSQVVEGTPTPNWTAYAVAKSSLVTMSHYLAAEYGPSGVTVNIIAPGMTETGMIGDLSEKSQLLVARQTPNRRLAMPNDIAASVSYLVSQSASHITGQTLRVNGGMVMA